MVTTMPRTDDAAPRTVQHVNRGRILSSAAAALGAIVTVVTAVAFTAWVNVDNAITYPADETGRAAVYPANHALYGGALGVALAAGVALTVAATWLVVVKGEQSLRRSILLVVAAVFSGAAVPISIQHSVVLASPLLAVAIAAGVIASTTGRQRHRS